MNARVLITDDEAPSRFILKKMFQSKYVCDEAENGLELVGQFASQLQAGNVYSLVVVDIHMPKMDGVNAIEAIRALEVIHEIPHSKQCKILCITIEQEIRIVMNSYNSGTDGYLVKPLSKSAINKWLEEFALPVI